MNYKGKPRPRSTDDLCSKHNRRLKDFEIYNGGCMLCAQEAKQEERNVSTVVHVLPPEIIGKLAPACTGNIDNCFAYPKCKCILCP